MDPIHRKVLQNQRSFLLDNLSGVKWTLEVLYTEGLIDLNDKEQISVHSTSLECKIALLDLLPHLGSRAFDVFLSSLNDDQHVARSLRHELANVQAHPPENGLPFLNQLDSSFLKRPITEPELQTVAQNFPPTKLSLVASCMGIHKARLEQIQDNNPHYKLDVIRDVFISWQRSKGSKATIEAFIRVLHEGKVGRDVYKCLWKDQSCSV